MTWDDIFCWLGWHGGRWSEPYERSMNYSDPKTGKVVGDTFIQHTQKFTCPNCGIVKTRELHK